MTRQTTVRPLEMGDLPTIVPVLAKAFHDDPAGAWLFPSALRRTVSLERFFMLYIRELALSHGACVTTNDLAGAALWKPPGTWKASPLTQVRLLPAFTRLFGRRLGGVLRGFAEIEKVHPRAPHAYLPIVGVAPHRQNEGIGSSLMVPTLQRCDREGIGAYLEATSDANRRLYERVGFEVTQVLDVHGGLTLWPMWRDPR